jgi:AcrR family transcriptional regulator
MSDAPIFERARRPEQKEQRRAAILVAAAELATERGVRAVTLGDIAGSAGMAKSNVLRYFGTREEIYLDLLLDASNAWEAELASVLADVAPDAQAVAGAVAGSIATRPLLCDLLAQMAATLEHNVRPEQGRDFKTGMLTGAYRLGALLRGAMPWLDDARAIEAAAATVLTVAAVWPTCTTPQAILDLLDPALLALIPDSFEDRLRRMLEMSYVGLEHL